MKSEYTQEFRDRAVELTLRGDRSVAAVAKELGVNVQTLHGWRREYRRKALKASGSESSSRLSQAEEIALLRKELKRVTEERDILKKAVGYFASPAGK